MVKDGNGQLSRKRNSERVGEKPEVYAGVGEDLPRGNRTPSRWISRAKRKKPFSRMDGGQQANDGTSVQKPVQPRRLS